MQAHEFPLYLQLQSSPLTCVHNPGNTFLLGLELPIESNVFHNNMSMFKCIVNSSNNFGLENYIYTHNVRNRTTMTTEYIILIWAIS